MIDRFTIEVLHEEPVSMAVLLEGLSIVFEATERAALDILVEYGRDYDLSDDFWLAALSDVHTLVPECFWLESVEQGSSRFHGYLKPIVVAFIAGLASKVAFDVIKDTEPYLQMKAVAVSQIDETWDRVVSYINNPPEPRPHDAPRVEAMIVGDRVRFVVIPPKERRMARNK